MEYTEMIKTMFGLGKPKVDKLEKLKEIIVYRLKDDLDQTVITELKIILDIIEQLQNNQVVFAYCKALNAVAKVPSNKPPLSPKEFMDFLRGLPGFIELTVEEKLEWEDYYSKLDKLPEFEVSPGAIQRIKDLQALFDSASAHNAHVTFDTSRIFNGR